ncbi:hypothetical protein [Luteolibacter soli]|uniref:PepSY domain-containing protein n=1 Tax=Luteolibacter soli TaxID=3135280 RepID=A0ABU9AV85_9BACT
MRRPFYKSRLFWCGVPGLVFLVWAWVISFHHVPRVMSWVSSVGPGISAGYNEWEARLQQGKVIFHRGLLLSAPPGVKAHGSGPGFDYNGYLYLQDKPTQWGRDVTVTGLQRLGKKCSIREVEWWLSMRFVVAGYVGVWLGMVWWWQWRKRRVVEKGVC